ncbi:hypothetical protein AVEN_23281-1 [Araneus ventricosus]|uniref:Mos1 transposase HTH domain-containing protein n=1 Tax=Araneus ventricosus TaxID=182803 RepID=A0A4Y2TWF6_ARAVE|nr:hypothetical protein AVEN_23281-1 [Araneus ventricosus]
MRGVIRFLWAKKLSAADIHRELCAVYGTNIMSEGVVRQWVRFFKDGRTNIHDESRSGRPSVVSPDLIKKIDEKIRLLRDFTITQLSEHLPNISRTLLYETVTGKSGYRKFCARWVPEMLTEIHKTSRMGAALKFLSQYHTGGEDFLNRILGLCFCTITCALTLLPDLAPSDFHLFTAMKKWLGGQHFADDEELKNAVTHWLKSQAAALYAEGIGKWVKRYDKCLNNGGDYVEK